MLFRSCSRYRVKPPAGIARGRVFGCFPSLRRPKVQLSGASVSLQRVFPYVVLAVSRSPAVPTPAARRQRVRGYSPESFHACSPASSFWRPSRSTTTPPPRRLNAKYTSSCPAPAPGMEQTSTTFDCDRSCRPIIDMYLNTNLCLVKINQN